MISEDHVTLKTGVMMLKNSHSMKYVFTSETVHLNSNNITKLDFWMVVYVYNKQQLTWFWKKQHSEEIREWVIFCKVIFKVQNCREVIVSKSWAGCPGVCALMCLIGQNLRLTLWPLECPVSQLIIVSFDLSPRLRPGNGHVPPAAQLHAQPRRRLLLCLCGGARNRTRVSLLLLISPDCVHAIGV